MGSLPSKTMVATFVIAVPNGVAALGFTRNLTWPWPRPEPFSGGRKPVSASSGQMPVLVSTTLMRHSNRPACELNMALIFTARLVRLEPVMVVEFVGGRSRRVKYCEWAGAASSRSP